MKRPRRGDERLRLRFALLPTRLDDGSVAWLRPYWVRQRRVQHTLKENAFWQVVEKTTSRA